MRQRLWDCAIQLEPAENKVRLNYIKQAQQEVARQHPQDTVVKKRPLSFLLDEIDQVIRARSISSLQEYQYVRRVGRGTGFNRQRHRPIMWEIYERYQQLLDEAGFFDWKDLPRLIWKHCGQLPQYDVVIIDEAQDFPPSHLYLATQLIPNYEELRSLTLLADPAQSIYYRGIPWKEAGIDIRGGRTRVLAKNFRNTQQILEAARYIVEGCDDLKAEEEYIPPTSTNKKGPKPVQVGYKNRKQSNEFMIAEILRLCQYHQYRPGDIAILSRSRRLYRFLIDPFKRANLNLRPYRDDAFHILENEVKFVTMHSAKGLEFPVVFIIGLDNKYFPFIHSESETKDEDLLQERKLFYVSMTRAAERLYLLYPQYNRCRFLYNLAAATVREKRR